VHLGPGLGLFDEEGPFAGADLDFHRVGVAENLRPIQRLGQHINIKPDRLDNQIAVGLHKSSTGILPVPMIHARARCPCYGLLKWGLALPTAASIPPHPSSHPASRPLWRFHWRDRRREADPPGHGISV